MNRRGFQIALAASMVAMTWRAEAGGSFDGTWVLAEIGGKSVSANAGRIPGFSISGNDITGFDGCNQFGGRLDRPGEIVATRMACVGDYIAIPLDLSDVGAHLHKATRSGDTLSLPASGGLPASVFKRG